MNGDSPKNKNFGLAKRRVPGLRDEAQASPCKVYKIINGEKKLIRIEKAGL